MTLNPRPETPNQWGWREGVCLGFRVSGVWSLGLIFSVCFCYGALKAEGGFGAPGLAAEANIGFRGFRV